MKARRWLLALSVSAVWVALRFTFNREYEGAPWEALVEGTAKLPFGHRVLVPSLVRPFVHAGASTRTAFAAAEWLATAAALTGVEAALRRFIAPRSARIGALAFFAVLALAFLLPLRWPIFYPWDLPAIACIAWGVALAHERRHGALVILATLGAANRESAILLPLVTVALLVGTEHRREALRSASLQLVGVVMTRLAIGVLRPTTEGAALDLRVEGMWRIDHNLQWLSEPRQALVILGAFSLLPALWWVVRPWMPIPLRRLELVILPVMAGLMVVANVYEPRAWGEPLVLLFLGVAVGATRGSIEDFAQPEPPLALDRWATPAVIGALALALLAWWIAGPDSA